MNVSVFEDCYMSSVVMNWMISGSSTTATVDREWNFVCD